MSKMFEKEPELVFLSFIGALCVVVLLAQMITPVSVNYDEAAIARCIEVGTSYANCLYIVKNTPR